MIYETHSTVSANPIVRHAELIQEALQWVRGVKPDIEPGRYDLRGDDFYALVQMRKALRREERPKVEVHRKYADLQFCLEGGEFIDWYPMESLSGISEYNEEKDYQLFDRPAIEPLPLLMRKGYFALLFPGDGHVPMVSDGTHTSTRMIVFKIRTSVF